MELSLSFLFIIIFVILPGLLFRRLYYYGEFSKQFNAGQNLGSLVAISSVPGFVLSIFAFCLYSLFFENIDLGVILDVLKDINNPSYKLQKDGSLKLNDALVSEVAPYLSFLYIISFLFGSIAGRLVRITRLDTTFKLLRFKNFWFYLFTGQYSGFRKFKHLRKKNKRHLFTKADILLDTNAKTFLYSGIVIDYEISNDNCYTLTKVVLQNAERYRMQDGKRIKVEIPGTLLVVDCSTMKNINLTYIYEDVKSIVNSKLPYYLEIGFGLIIILLIPFFIFRSVGIDLGLYKTYFQMPWYQKIFSYFFCIQLLSIFNPFEKKKDGYGYVGLRSVLLKILWLFIFLIMMNVG